MADRHRPPHRRHRHVLARRRARSHPMAYRDGARRRRAPGRRRASPSCPRCRAGPTGMLFGLQSSLHPFITHPTYRAPRRSARWPSGSAAAPRPRCGPRCWPRSPRRATRWPSALMTRWDQMFPLGDPPDYEPAPSTSASPPVAEREGRRPAGGRPRLAARAGRHGAALRPAGRLRGPRPRGDAGDDGPPADGARAGRRRRPLRPDLRRLDADVPADPLGPRPHPGRAARPRAGRAPADRPHRRDLRLRRPRHPRARQAGRPQPHRPRRPDAPRAGDGLRPARRRPPPRSSGPTATAPRSWPACRPSTTVWPPAPAPGS